MPTPSRMHDHREPSADGAGAVSTEPVSIAPGPRFRVWGGLRCALLCVALGAAQAAAQPADVEGRVRALNAEVADAQRRGAHAEAAATAERVLALARGALGPRHPDTFGSMNNLAFAYQAQGRLADAERLFREVLQAAREAPRPQDLRTFIFSLVIMDNLAGLYQDQGRYDEAEALLGEALEGTRAALGPSDPKTLIAIDRLASLYQAQGRYERAEPLRREVLQARREALGPRHLDTLTSVVALALVYQAQGRYGEAEPLLLESLQIARETLGPRHRGTLRSMNNLAMLYQAQGRFDDAEQLLRETLEEARIMLGPQHLNTIGIVNNLAYIYAKQGRYGEAESLLREALQLRREALGLRHPDTLAAMNNLASIYAEQGRYDEAEALLREALRLTGDTLDPRYPDTLDFMYNLAKLHLIQRRYSEAEALHREVLQARRKVLGPQHSATLSSMDSLADLYLIQRRNGDAEPLYREVLQVRRDTLGLRHPDTLGSMGKLALLYRMQGRFNEAEPLLHEALEGAQAVLGPAHPTTLFLQLERAENHAALGRPADAVRQLRAMQASLLARLGNELHTTEAPGVRNRLVASQALYQDVALTLAVMPEAGADAADLAASAMLRLKGVQAEEDAHLARIARSGRDPRARAIAAELAGLHDRLAALFHAQGKQEEIAALTARLQAQELALGRGSQEYDRQLQVRNFDPSDLRAALAGIAGGAALFELRQYRPIDFRTGEGGPPRWAGLLHLDGARVFDLGPAASTVEAVKVLSDERADLEGEAERSAARALYDRLFGPLAAELDGVERLYVAPDGDLHLAPFAALPYPDGRRLAERFDLRVLQTGRDLLRPAPEHPARGLLALGGIDFDAPASPAAEATAAVPSPTAVAAAGGVTVPGLRVRAEAPRVSSFIPLPDTLGEARAVADLYRSARPDEPVEVWEGAGASEARLRAHGPPRALHLATHGFYRPVGTPLDRPLLLAGIALAGANRALREPGRDGVLYAIEAQDLDLDGTELVVLSACDTARGQIDYGEGVSGLVRALRTAGARHVLVALRPVSDEGAADFMGRFYRHWLAQARSDPAAAFRAAQIEAMAASPDSPARRDQTWAHFALVGK